MPADRHPPRTRLRDTYDYATRYGTCGWPARILGDIAENEYVYLDDGETDHFASRTMQYLPAGVGAVTGALLTPTTARDLHRNLIEWWGSREAQEFAEVRADHWAEAEAAAGRGERRAVYFTEVNPGVEQRRLRAAETFLITDDMSAVCRHAAMSLPTLAVDHSLLPAEIGLVVFNDRLTDHDGSVASTIPLEVACWYPATFDNRSGVAVETYILPATVGQIRAAEGKPDADYIVNRVVERWRMPATPALWMFLPYGVEPPREAMQSPEDEYAVRMLVSAWLLMDQPIAAREHPRIYRPAAKRAERAGLVSDLTVVTLRQPRSEPADGLTSREFHRRWIVRGHWRRVPTGEQPARVTWVHGYVKGPAGAPLVMTDRVTVLAR